MDDTETLNIAKDIKRILDYHQSSLEQELEAYKYDVIEFYEDRGMSAQAAVVAIQQAIDEMKKGG